mgnify:FL=1
MRRVAKAVDPGWEPAAMAKLAFQARSDDDAFGLLFENVTGSEFRPATGIPVYVHSVLL